MQGTVANIQVVTYKSPKSDITGSNPKCLLICKYLAFDLLEEESSEVGEVEVSFSEASGPKTSSVLAFSATDSLAVFEEVFALVRADFLPWDFVFPLELGLDALLPLFVSQDMPLPATLYKFFVLFAHN